MKRIAFALIAATAVLFTATAGLAQQPKQQHIAGTTPDRRPEGAPVVSETGLTMFGLAMALRGISQPVPPNLDFLDDQGAWFTPFTRPGMTGPYDIRGLHTGLDHGSAK